jgi:feruloyl esterase
VFVEATVRRGNAYVALLPDDWNGYGRPPEHSYFIGCSNGGREALMEAQRYPANFDGIVAIAPSSNFLEFTAAFVRNLQAQYPTGPISAAEP